MCTELKGFTNLISQELEHQPCVLKQGNLLGNVDLYYSLEKIQLIKECIATNNKKCRPLKLEQVKSNRE